jgi:hypothetical protein
MSARGMLARMMNQPKLKSKLFFPRDENKGVIFPTYTTRGLLFPQSTRPRGF